MAYNEHVWDGLEADVRIDQLVRESCDINVDISLS